MAKEKKAPKKAAPKKVAEKKIADRPSRRKSNIDPIKQIDNLAKRIKSLRIAKGYTSYEYFAYDHGFSRSQFGRYESGKDIRFTTLLRIAEAFDMTVIEFLSEGFD